MNATYGAPAPRGPLIAYVAGSVGNGIYATVPGVLLLFYMTEVLKIPAALAGVAMFMPKALGAFIDPLVGSASDRTKTSWGPRRPWMFSGALVLAPALCLLFRAPSTDPVVNFAYVTIVYAFSTIAYSSFAVPYVAAVAEISPSSAERTRAMSFRMTFLLVGLLIGSSAGPRLVRFLGTNRNAFGEMSLILAGLRCAAMLTAVAAAAHLPSRIRTQGDATPFAQIGTALRNSRFRLMAGVYMRRRSPQTRARSSRQLLACSAIMPCRMSFDRLVAAMSV